MTVKPNLFILGAQKAGTSTLAQHLNTHEQIYMPARKELLFFNQNYSEVNEAKYLNYFKNCINIKYRMDATPSYFYTTKDKNIPIRIKLFSDSCIKFLAILRHPTSRAIAAFYHHFRMGRINSFDRIRKLPAEKLGIIDIGFYSKHLDAYYAHFQKDLFHILIFEEYIKNPRLQVNQVLKFLELDSKNYSANTIDKTNVGLKLESSNNQINVKDGINQVLKLKSTNPDFKKMPSIDPPIVEDLDFVYLNEIYKDEIYCIKKLLPNLHIPWSEHFKAQDHC